MKQQELTITAKILLNLFTVVDVLPKPFESKSGYIKRLIKNKTDYWSYYKALLYLERKGWVKVVQEREKKYIQLTKTGKLETLFIKAQLSQTGPWDGKWRMAVFDIPEDARAERNKLRKLLKTNGYKMIQQSVFVNPLPLSREGLDYLQQTGLDKYIRFFRIDEADNDKALRNMFGL